MLRMYFDTRLGGILCLVCQGYATTLFNRERKHPIESLRWFFLAGGSSLLCNAPKVRRGALPEKLLFWLLGTHFVSEAGKRCENFN